ncbi:hypothetical protein NT6N_03140 [Oceaniferula spumae]|uniref:Uncharacterized protein n=1 Tax=Oceaniferula spumae TaxID=2979115 RepID=A0AAT9FH31_9BACT
MANSKNENIDDPDLQRQLAKLHAASEKEARGKPAAKSKAKSVSVNLSDVKSLMKRISTNDSPDGVAVHTLESAKLWVKYMGYRLLREIEIRYVQHLPPKRLPEIEPIYGRSPAPEALTSNNKNEINHTTVAAPGGVGSRLSSEGEMPPPYPSKSWTSIEYNNGISNRVFLDVAPPDVLSGEDSYDKWHEILVRTKNFISGIPGSGCNIHTILKLGRQSRKWPRPTSEDEDQYLKGVAGGHLKTLKHNLRLLGLLADSEYMETPSPEYLNRLNDWSASEEVDIHLSETDMLEIAPDLLHRKDPRMIWKMINMLLNYHNSNQPNTNKIIPAELEWKIYNLRAEIWELAEAAFLAGMATQRGQLATEGKHALRGEQMTPKKGASHRHNKPIYEAIKEYHSSKGNVPTYSELIAFIGHQKSAEWHSAIKDVTEDSIKGLIKRYKKKS